MNRNIKLFTKEETLQLNQPENADEKTENGNQQYIIKLTNNKLTIIGSGSIDISHIKENLCTETWIGFIRTTQVLAKSGKYSAGTLTNRIRAVVQFLKAAPTSHITTESILAYYEKCRIKGSRFIDLKRMLIDWNKLGFFGVSAEVTSLLLNLQKPKKPRPIGCRVRSDDPTEGWYTEQEYDNLLKVIWSDYENNRNSLWNTTACLLIAQYARRPIQLANLKIGDLKDTGESHGTKGKRIEFPGAKEKNTSEFRSAKIETHPIDEALWRLCQLQAAASIALIEGQTKRKITPEEAQELPLFLQPENVGEKLILAKKYSTTEGSFLSSNLLHPSGLSISRALYRKKINATAVISNRTGERLIENAYRFRYTRAKQLARLGIPRATLLYWMGHADPKSIEAYYDDPAERARTLNDAISPYMAPLAQAFLGTIRDRESDAERGIDPSSRVELDGRSELGVGTCGEHGFCSASVPIPCYRCTKFQPWVYGPHEEVLQRLLERQQLENEIPRVGYGKRLLLPVQLEKDIAAVRQVIMLCQNRKHELEKKNE